MAAKDYDPFEAWSRFRAEQPARLGKNILSEALNPGQLHDPKDFVEKLREVAAETASQAAALEQFVEAHDGDPAWNGQWRDDLVRDLAQLSELAESLAKLTGPITKALVQREAQADAAHQAQPKSGGPPGKLFKK